MPDEQEVVSEGADVAPADQINPENPDVLSLSVRVDTKTGHIAVNHNCSSDALALQLVANAIIGLSERIHETDVELRNLRASARAGSILKPGDAGFGVVPNGLFVPGNGRAQ